MRRRALGRKKGQFLPVFLAITLIIVSLLLIFGRRQTDFESIGPENGVLDIRDVDFSKQVYNVANNWDFYGGRLYTPEDFANGGETLSQQPEKEKYYGTYRLLIKAQPNTYYTLFSYSVDYGTRVFVNGAEVLNVGVVSDDPQRAMPQVDTMNIPLYSGGEGRIEIIYQYSNFVHRDGGFIQPTYLSTPENIKHMTEGTDLGSLFFGGALIFFFFYFLLNSALQLRLEYLCLAFCCLLMALRDQNFFVIHLLPASRNWFVYYRFLILIVSMQPASILVLLASMYPRAANFKVTLVYIMLAVIAAVLHFVLPTQGLVYLCKYFYFISVPYLIYLVFCVTRQYIREKSFDAGDILTILGYIFLLVSLISEALLTQNSSSVSRKGIAPSGMLLFILLISIAIALRLQKKKEALAESRRKNEMLEQMNTMSKDFLHKVAHELNTPLTVISGYAQLTDMQLAESALDDKTSENLKTIQSEAQRLGNMVSKLMEYSFGRSSSPEFMQVSVKELIDCVLAVAVPMCMKNNNSITAELTDCPSIHGNLEMLMQICLNLIVNANKHTDSGRIRLAATWDKDSPETVSFCVSDTGSGISPMAVPHIFEKGYSGDGGSGLGLFICREAVELHGGRLVLESTGINGSVFRFTIPVERAQVQK